LKYLFLQTAFLTDACTVLGKSVEMCAVHLRGV